jgi:6-phosphogluconate dehydrogenase (decarboxylating)
MSPKARAVWLESPSETLLGTVNNALRRVTVDLGNEYLADHAAFYEAMASTPLKLFDAGAWSRRSGIF